LASREVLSSIQLVSYTVKMMADISPEALITSLRQKNAFTDEYIYKTMSLTILIFEILEVNLKFHPIGSRTRDFSACSLVP
jgi:hypothetical protein